jgi:ATP-dependent DNA helicase RecG
MSTRQKGRNDLKLASLRRDRETVAVAREIAFSLVDGPGGLGAHPLLEEEVDLLLAGDDDEYLLKS